jgi:VanZ family protein
MASRQFLFRAQYWTLLFAWLVLIGVLSRDTFSAANTARFLRALEILSQGILDLEPANFLLRKSMHVVVYATLTLLGYAAFRRALGPRRLGLTTVLAIALCCTAASADEYHQSLQSQRTGRPRDVLLDVFAGGIVAGIALLCRNRIHSGALLLRR